MAKYFTLKEMTRSETAKKYGIDNTPSPEIVEHLNELMEFLDPLREAWGSAIKVTSGYRCPKLNSLVKGSATSVHKIGYASDLKPVNGKIEDFKTFVKNYLKDKKFDQCILEKSKTTGDQWVHIGLYNNAHKQRCQIKLMTV